FRVLRGIWTGVVVRSSARSTATDLRGDRSERIAEVGAELWGGTGYDLFYRSCDREGDCGAQVQLGKIAGGLKLVVPGELPSQASGNRGEVGSGVADGA